jgi:uncharacterized membrane protein
VSRLLAPAAAAFVSAWVAVVVAAPRLPATIAASIYAIGALICHQRPERSFHLAGAQLPVCARCLGIYAGAAAGLIAASGGRVSAARRPAVTILLATLPTIITLVVEWAGLSNPGNAMRAAAGAVLGAGVAAVVVTLHYDECTPRRPSESSPRRPSI